MATQQRCRRSANISAIEGRPAVPFPPRRRSPARMQESHRSRTSPYGKSTSRRTRMRHENEWIRANAPDIEEPVNQLELSCSTEEQRHDPAHPCRSRLHLADYWNFVTVFGRTLTREIPTTTTRKITIFVGYYVVWSVTPALHTPLMSVTNAISSVIVVGALLAVGVAAISSGSILAKVFGFLALVMASVNIFGGFLVTQRMLAMYKKNSQRREDSAGSSLMHCLAWPPASP
jgi:H+-translocating NAD(P) transhydrogenase subunit alpha